MDTGPKTIARPARGSSNSEWVVANFWMDECSGWSDKPDRSVVDNLVETRTHACIATSVWLYCNVLTTVSTTRFPISHTDRKQKPFAGTINREQISDYEPCL